MKITIIFLLLNMAYVSAVNAESVQDLQQRASFAYEQMMDAKNKADILAREATGAENRKQKIEQSLISAQQDADEARKKSEEARLIAEQATLRWNQSSDALSREWGKSER